MNDQPYPPPESPTDPELLTALDKLEGNYGALGVLLVILERHPDLGAMVRLAHDRATAVFPRESPDPNPLTGRQALPFEVLAAVVDVEEALATLIDRAGRALERAQDERSEIKAYAARLEASRDTLARELDHAMTRDANPENEPYLGCATTEQLITELAARAEVSRRTGESWPNYRTVDSE